jgi:cyclic beta-1,2-glucan synthetase
MGDISFQLETEKYQNKIPYISFTKQEYEQAEPEMGDVKYFNGFGGFAEDEYVIKLSPDIKTPLPWCNVIAEKNTGLLSRRVPRLFMYQTAGEQAYSWTNDPVRILCMK